MSYRIDDSKLTLDQLDELIRNNSTIELSEQAAARINKCREYLDLKLESSDDPIYGINTGFGALHNTKIKDENLEQLQKNLVMSHACGMGETVPKEIVRLMLLLKAKGLAFGHSAVQLSTVERLLDFYNNNVIPVVYQQGSLGASGDLSPLAHMTLPLIGMGEIWKDDDVVDGGSHGHDPIKLKSKEGLALLNGTQFMSAYGAHLTLRSRRLALLADLIATLSLEAFDCMIDPFDEDVHALRSQAGQNFTASAIRKYLEGSELIEREKSDVQDPYSFRCIPQVHGATKDAIDFTRAVFEKEINSVTDNPTIFPDQDKIVSAGNFHGQPLSLALDQLAIAMAELGSISERRTYKLISGQRGLPAFLVANPGLNSGFMIPQYTAASIVSQNKQLCTPASVDSIDSSNGQEDHVSMGANAATKCHRVVENLESIMAIELYCAAQALEFRRPAKSSPVLEQFVTEYRKHVPFVEEDVVNHDHMKASLDFIRNTEIP